MKKIALALALIIFLGVARAQETISGTHTYTYTPESSLRIEELEDGRLSVNVERGKNLVFTYEFSKKDNPAIADDEYIMHIIFEVPLGGTSFRYEAKDIKIVLMKGCFCSDRGYHRIVSGYVSGEKTCKGWKVKWQLETKTVPESEGNNWKSETKKPVSFIRPKAIKQKRKSK
jgi:hypothetical protein